MSDTQAQTKKNGFDPIWMVGSVVLGGAAIACRRFPRLLAWAAVYLLLVSPWDGSASWMQAAWLLMIPLVVIWLVSRRVPKAAHLLPWGDVANISGGRIVSKEIDPAWRGQAKVIARQWQTIADQADLGIKVKNKNGEMMTQAPNLLGIDPSPLGFVIAVQPIPGQTYASLEEGAARLETAVTCEAVRFEKSAGEVHYVIVKHDPLAGIRHVEGDAA